MRPDIVRIAWRSQEDSMVTMALGGFLPLRMSLPARNRCSTRWCARRDSELPRVPPLHHLGKERRRALVLGLAPHDELHVEPALDVRDVPVDVLDEREMLCGEREALHLREDLLCSPVEDVSGAYDLDARR